MNPLEDILADGLKDNELREYLKNHTPEIPPSHEGPVKAIEYASVVENYGSAPPRTKHIYVAGWRNSMGFSIVFAVAGVADDNGEIQPVEGTIDENDMIHQPQYGWANHFTDYVTIERLQK